MAKVDIEIKFSEEAMKAFKVASEHLNEAIAEKMEGVATMFDGFQPDAVAYEKLEWIWIHGQLRELGARFIPPQTNLLGNFRCWPYPTIEPPEDEISKRAKEYYAHLQEIWREREENE